MSNALFMPSDLRQAGYYAFRQNEKKNRELAIQQRNTEIVFMREDGLTYKEIGKRVGLSGAACRSVYENHEMGRFRGQLAMERRLEVRLLTMVCARAVAYA